MILVRGNGTYNTTYIDIRMIINPKSLSVEIWESNPSNSDFITLGSHKGFLLSDMTRITAVWTTESTGEKGDLILTATK